MYLNTCLHSYIHTPIGYNGIADILEEKTFTNQLPFMRISLSKFLLNIKSLSALMIHENFLFEIIEYFNF